MFQKLVSHNDDLSKILDRGYAVAIDSTNHMVIREIPYLDKNGDLQIGAIVSKLKFIDKFRFAQQDHQIYFAGEIPHGLNEKPLPNLGGGPFSIALSDACSDVQVQRSFSNKPKATGKYKNHFHKIETYVSFISGPAMQKFNVTPYTYNASDEALDDPVFKFRDTLTSRSNITDLSQKFTEDVIAVIGLGGTGAYVLDFMVKTPAREIRGFDPDHYHVHNAYRSPGLLDESELGMLKAEVYRGRYENFRDGLNIKSICIDDSTKSELEGVTFAFVCVDNGDARSEIFDVLISLNIPFIDVGMGLKRDKGDCLSGMVRNTLFPEGLFEEVRDKKWATESEDPDNIYKSNIQISELNAMNACLAVFRFKQLRGFYCSNSEFLNTIFNIRSSNLVREGVENGS